MMKTRKKIFFFLGVCLCVGFLIAWLSQQYVTPIIMYHSVDSLEKNKNTVSPEMFERQMRYIQEHGYKVISLDQLVDEIESGKKFLSKSVAISFDDGYSNNFQYAFPILERYGFPATFFICANWIGGDGRLNLEQIKQMQKAGMSFESHSISHGYLPELSPQERHREIAGSKRVLEEQLGHPVNYFAYPIGGFNDAIKDEIKQAGYRAAFTSNRGLDRSNRRLYEIKRIRFSEEDSGGWRLWYKLSGFYNLFRSSKSPS